jgi:hypothetical protein
MNRSTLAKRYLPLAVVLAVQLLIIAVVPSKAPGSTVAAGLSGSGGGLTSGGDTTGTVPGDVAGATGGAAGSSGGGATGGATSGAVKAGQKFTGPIVAANGGINYPDGDRSHCVGGRQFDPAIYYWAPPCQGKFAGVNNGPTSPGVNADGTIEILDYRSKGSPAVDAILRAQMAYVEPQQQIDFDAAAQDFINKNFELWGRKVHIQMVQGTCDSIPPNYPCLRNEVNGLVQQYHPYLIKWNTSLASPFFAQASADKVVNVGGWHFRDSFNQAWAPYHWDVQMSGTDIAKHIGELWCKELNGKKAIYAGEPRNATENDLRGNTRVLGVISTNDPENKKMVQGDLREALAACSTSYAHEYYYAQDITTAEQQRKDGVAAMEKSPVSTDVLCLCDLVAPGFLYETEEEDHYRPENLIAGTGYMDTDAAARVYDSSQVFGSDPTCKCNHVFENAFGLSQIQKQEPVGNDTAARFWHASGRSGAAPYTSAAVDVDYYQMIGTLLQQAGPTLSPQTMQIGAQTTPLRGGAGNISRGFTKGNYSWAHDMRQVYWSGSHPSSYDGKAGSYIDKFPGQRFLLGSYASGDFVLPPKPRN